MTSPHLWSTSQFVRIHFLSSVVICLYAYVIKLFVPEKSKQTFITGSRTKSAGAESWTIEGLCSDYSIPFHQ